LLFVVVDFVPLVVNFAHFSPSKMETKLHPGNAMNSVKYGK
jgi:hypothetical protein